jgi:hypothetical protein
MADNDTTLDAAGASVTYATDDISSVKYPRVKVVAGADGVARRDLAFESSMYHLVAAATTNAVSVKASAGWVNHIQCSNINASVRYLKFHNTAGVPTPGSGVVYTVPIPGAGAAGGIANLNFGQNPLYFSTGIGISVVTDVADAGSTAVAASEIHINIGYL